MCTSDGGLLAFRELDEALGLTEMVAQFLTDKRTRRNARHARYTCFRMADLSISRNLFVAIPRRIRRLIQPVPV